MKIYESWHRNTPDTLSGESITVTFTYCSFDKTEMDEFEKTLPKGLLVMDTETEKNEEENT